MNHWVPRVPVESIFSEMSCGVGLGEGSVLAISVVRTMLRQKGPHYYTVAVRTYSRPVFLFKMLEAHCVVFHKGEGRLGRPESMVGCV